MSDSRVSGQSKVPFAWLVDWWRRQWRRTAVILLVLLAVLLLVRAVANVWIGHQLNEEVAALEKVYGRLDLATLVLPTVPPAENRARAERAAATLLVVGRANLQWVASRLFTPASNGGLSASATDDLRRLVDENQFALQVAQQARLRPRSNWEIDYAHDQYNLPSLLDVRNLGIVIAASCRVSLGAGRGDQAAQAAMAGLAEAASLSREPSLIIQLIRISVANEQLRCVRAVLERSGPSTAVLSDLAGALADSRTPGAFHAAFVGELKFVNYSFGRMESGYAVEQAGIAPSPMWAGPLAWLCRPLIQYGHLRALRGIARVVEVASQPPHARRAGAIPAGRPANMMKWWQFVNRFDASVVWPGLVRAADSGYQLESVMNAAELAVALRRFRLDRGAYPDTLALLAPQYLAQVPIDPFTGRPPEYARQGTGFKLRVHGAPGLAPSDLLEWEIPR